MVSGVALRIDRWPLSSKTVIATVMVGHGATVYKLFFWASAASFTLLFTIVLQLVILTPMTK